nr:MAG TPA: hypothetical protein [Bacteriophage sp.]
MFEYILFFHLLYILKHYPINLKYPILYQVFLQ